jgi:hypothetical protein
MPLPTPRSTRTPSARLILPAWAAFVLAVADLPAAGQDQVWVRQLGTWISDETRAAAPDGSGGVYVTGFTQFSLAGPSAGGRDAWLARYDGTGTPIWIRQKGTILDDEAHAAAPDGSGGIYVAGFTSASFVPTNFGGRDVWFARYDGGGNILWIRQLGTLFDDYAYAAVQDATGGVYVAGHTYGSLGGPSAGSLDAWLARYDAAGNEVWILQIGTGTGDWISAAAPDGSGGVYVIGSTYGSLGGSMVGGGDAWLARYDSAGNQLWMHQFGTLYQEIAYAAAPDGSGGVYSGGYTFGGLGGPRAGSSDAWLARHDDSGNLLWIRQLGTTRSETTRAAAPDGSGGVYLTGWSTGGLGGPNAGGVVAWLARYDHMGNQLWTGQVGPTYGDLGYAAAPDGSGGLYVGGATGGNLGGMYAGFSDAWFARYGRGCGAISSYCTPKINSTGCTPLISALGNPTVSPGLGFFVEATRVLDNQFGFFFYSTSGQQAVSFHGGMLCAKPPLMRTPLQTSGGTPPCGGTFILDFNAYIASGKDPQLIAGATVDGQYWSRDPGFAPPDNTSLTGGLHFVICP